MVRFFLPMLSCRLLPLVQDNSDDAEDNDTRRNADYNVHPYAVDGKKALCQQTGGNAENDGQEQADSHRCLLTYPRSTAKPA